MKFSIKDDVLSILLDERETKMIVDTYTEKKNCSYIFVSKERLNDLKEKIHFLEQINSEMSEMTENAKSDGTSFKTASS